MKKSELTKLIESIIESKLWQKDYERIDQEITLENKLKLIWMWIKQGKINKWTTFADTVDYLYGTPIIESICEGKCKKSGCTEKIDGKWRVRSNKTGKLWPQKYDNEQDAKDAIKGYHFHKNK